MSSAAALPPPASPTAIDGADADGSAANQGRKYKSRKERPCDACRRRKVCCIREPGDEACSLCRMQQTVCQYDQGPTPRRRRPPGAPRLSRSSAYTPTRSSGNPATPSPSIASRSHLPSEVAPPAAGEWISQYVGLSGDQDPFVLRHCNFNGSNYYKSGDWACLRVRTDGAFPSHFTLVPASHLDARPPHYPSSDLLNAAYPLHHDLLATYFEIIHTSYPILDPSRFIKGNKIDTPLLATMYSLARPFCPSAQTMPHEIPDAINSYVFQALPIEVRSPRLETIEAALLFIHRHTVIHRAPTTPGLYAEIGLLAGMCFDAGINIDPTRWDLSQADRSRRKRLWWALHIHDKWAALGLGRPSYLHEDDCNVPLLTIEDVPPNTVSGEPLPPTSAQMFVAMAALSQILSLLLTHFYTLKAVTRLPMVPVEEVAELGRFFERQLTAFYTEHLLPLTQVNDMLLDPTGTLFLAYHTCELVLYRALLRSMTPPNLLSQPLRIKAKTVVASVSKLLKNLQVTRLRAFWWSPISRINFAMTGGFMFSMLLSSVADEDIEYWSSEISKYRRLLDMQSLGFDTTKLAAARMGLLADMSHGERLETAGEGVDPKQAFCRDFGVELNSL